MARAVWYFKPDWVGNALDREISALPRAPLVGLSPAALTARGYNGGRLVGWVLRMTSLTLDPVLLPKECALVAKRHRMEHHDLDKLKDD